jgi:L-aminopeptidase/D-esterase-like protein
VSVNATGSPVDLVTGRLRSDREQRLTTPSAGEREALARAGEHPAPSLATVIGVLLTDATLTKAHAGRLAGIGHDGMARAVAPVHSMMDGDTVFALASGRRSPAEDLHQALVDFNRLLAAAAETFTDACLDALLAAETRGPWPAYRDLAPSAGR